VTAQDHNKTLVILHAGLGLFFTPGLIAAPWIIAQNFRRPDKMLFCGRRFWSCISCRDPFLVHGDCHVSKKANRQDFVIDRVGGRDPDGLADWSLHLVVHA
jgi:hypothetical protein